ncbi:MAG: hypothetical protein ACYCV7_03600 [Acidimicrobiales bacterium]
MKRVVAFVPNLLDRSRVESAVPASGASIEFVGDISELASAAAAGAELVIIDLDRPGVMGVLPGLGETRTLGFGSHVNPDLLQSARNAGCDEVLTRSAMFRRLASILGCPT